MRENGTRTNIIVRGVQPASRKLRPDFRIIEGRDLTEGKGECIVSPSMSQRFKGAQIGGRLDFGDKESYQVVGIFTAGGSSAESEVWADFQDVVRNTGREGSVSCVQLRAADRAAYDQLRNTIENDTRFKLAAIPESVYFQNQSRSSIFLKGAGTLIAVLLTFGAMFAAANTMFAAVSSRTREIGTMRALGFSQLDILICFLGESLILCSLGRPRRPPGGHPAQRLDLRDERLQQLRLDDRRVPPGPLALGVAIAMTLAMGLFGGMLPALRAVRLDVISALRELYADAGRGASSPAGSSRVLEPHDRHAPPAACAGRSRSSWQPGRTTGTPGRASRNRSTGWIFRSILGVL